MGRDKARLVLARSSLLERSIAALEEVVPTVLLASGSTPRYVESGRECLLDVRAGVGPLAGLVAALERLQGAGIDYACVLACDMPGATSEVFRALLAEARATGADVCLVRTPNGTEPLCGVYHVRALPAVRAALERGERRMNAFHCEVRLASLEEARLGIGCARNLNTPGEFLAAGGTLS